MESITVLYIIIAAIAALGIVVFQYLYKQKAKSKINLLLAFLRFIGVFGLLLLLINPKFSQKTYTLEKPNLVILADNSSSISENGAELIELMSSIGASDKISDRFNVASYKFGTGLEVLDSLSFDEKYSNFHKSLSALKNIYSREQTITLLLSDGNQTIGEDYSFFKSNESNAINTVVLGDTTLYKDISVGPILTNKYAFLKNKFPLETYISYQGKVTASATVLVRMDNKVVHREKVELNADVNLKTITIQVDADSVGTKNIRIEVTNLQDERNVNNNVRSTSIEVIDEKTKIALVSDILHPDLGALKKAIESNEQREVSFLKPNTANNLEDIDLFIFYQPNVKFKKLFDFVKDRNSNSFVITGIQTDYNFLNRSNLGFEIESGYPEQEVFGLLNNGFSKYDIANFDLTDFPPLLSDAGPVLITTAFEPLLGTQIKGKDIQQPLLTVLEQNSNKKALLLGENLWKWRVQTYRNTGAFSNFDEFIANLVRYLTSSKNKTRLNVDYEKIYEGSNNTIITATYFDEAFLFDPNAKISIKVTDTKTKNTQTSPMILKNGYFESDLSNLIAGNYSFVVSVENYQKSETGSFVINEFNLENQFVSSDYLKLEKLATNSGGKLYYPSQIDELIGDLEENNTYVPTEKSTENIVSLIDFEILLAIIVFAFASEWFIRKYNGLT
ncbi:carboxypeptidase-like regulatory domain-containing protein [uncultured Maribacter sp.]|uniref:carboxypeptidase-like regulatory domain-containing protein n=1 Tax=uncultured Maribacter sp. TaxID=431308 RepID=UPI0030EE067D|tara:strand:+ start:1262 stop:3286 length:2025 start_codon:yes stop_codon:yes gene_type:complete